MFLSRTSGFMSFPSLRNEVPQSWVGPASGDVCGLGLVLVGGREPKLGTLLGHMPGTPKSASCIRLSNNLMGVGTEALPTEMVKLSHFLSLSFI